jgi:hypothetical protein
MNAQANAPDFLALQRQVHGPYHFRQLEPRILERYSQLAYRTDFRNMRCDQCFQPLWDQCEPVHVYTDFSARHEQCG